MASTYTIAHTFEIVDSGAGAVEAEVLIHYTVTPGAPDIGPSWASAGEPGYPATPEVERVELTDRSDAGRQLTELAITWIHGDGYDAALEEAAEQDESDREHAADLRRED